MNYKQIKESLLNNGFKLEWIHNGSYLDIPIFINPNIKGEVSVFFDYDESKEFTSTMVDGDTINYLDNTLIDNILVSEVVFNIKNGISNEPHGTNVSLGKQDVDDCFEWYLDLVVNPLAFIDYSEKYMSEVIKFNSLIKPFITILNKYKMDCYAVKLYEPPTAPMYSPFQYVFKKYSFNTVFQFNNITFKHNAWFGLGKQISIDFNMNLKVFEKQIRNELARLYWYIRKQK